MKTLIKGGHVLDPSTGKDGIFDVLVEGERIIKVEPSIDVKADQMILARGCYVMPGFIDLHVHLREPGFEHKETIRTGSMAAARGGFTSICPMPNTKPATDSPQMIRFILEKAREESVVHILPVGAVTIGQAGERLTDIAGMKAAGAVAISEDGKSVMNAKLYKEAMIEAKKAGLVVMAHCEDRFLVGDGALNEGPASARLGVTGINNDVEDTITARDILLAKSTGCRLHLCHCSTKDSVRMVELAKADGVDVSAEVCPHHFTLTEDDIKSDDANYKMNPPLRSKEDKKTLVEGLSKGIMETIATDHAPHHKDEKAKGIANAPFGIVGLETAFALTMTELVHTGYLTPMEMVERLSYAPAKILGIDKGTLKEGSVADITICNPDWEYTVNPEYFLSKGKNTPFGGYKAKGKVVKTMVSGKIVYEMKR